MKENPSQLFAGVENETQTGNHTLHSTRLRRSLGILKDFPK